MTVLPSNAYPDTCGHFISGRMILASLQCSHNPRESDKHQEDRVKYQLTEKLLRAIIEAKCVEFTRVVDNYTGEYTYRARCFVTPDDQVKILRTHLPLGTK
jgi:hypothetical protein